MTIDHRKLIDCLSVGGLGTLAGSLLVLLKESDQSRICSLLLGKPSDQVSAGRLVLSLLFEVRLSLRASLAHGSCLVL